MLANARDTVSVFFSSSVSPCKHRIFRPWVVMSVEKRLALHQGGTEVHMAPSTLSDSGVPLFSTSRAYGTLRSGVSAAGESCGLSYVSETKNRWRGQSSGMPKYYHPGIPKVPWDTERFLGYRSITRSSFFFHRFQLCRAAKVYRAKSCGLRVKPKYLRFAWCELCGNQKYRVCNVQCAISRCVGLQDDGISRIRATTMANCEHTGR